MPGLDLQLTSEEFDRKPCRLRVFCCFLNFFCTFYIWKDVIPVRAFFPQWNADKHVTASGKMFAGEAGGGFTSTDVWPTGSNDSLDASASLPQSPPPALTHYRLLHCCPFHCKQPKFWASLAHHIMLLIKILAFFHPFIVSMVI